jgi:maltooligosyltrehalose trehalohydrolase
MGEEYGETAPFPYFISHSDPTLVEVVRQGRREEFAAFHASGDFLDPQDEATFHSAKLNHRLRQHAPHAILQSLYKELIHLRQTQPPLARLDKDCLEVHAYEKAQVLFLRRWYETDDVMLLYHFGTSPTTLTLPVPAGQWQKRLDTAAEQWHGPGSTLPDLLMADGEVLLTLPGQAGALFIHSVSSVGPRQVQACSAISTRHRLGWR